MSSMQNYLKAQLHDHVFRTGSFTKPSGLYLALFTVKPGKDGAGGTEVSGGNYSRISCGPLDANWSAPDSAGESANLVKFEFPEPDADWGLLTSWGIADAASAGNFLIVEDLEVQTQVYSYNLSPQFPIGFLTFTWN
jgi:hypothetical protein